MSFRQHRSKADTSNTDTMLRQTRSSAKNIQPGPCSVELNKPKRRSSRPAPVEGGLRNITNTVKMSTAESHREASSKTMREPPLKKKKPNSTTVEGSTTTGHPELVAFEKLRIVLGRHYFDVCQRLTLDYVPRCVRNVTECALQHANKRGSRSKHVGLMRENHTHEQIAEHRPDQFVEFLYQTLMRSEFIGGQLFVAGLQLILTINRPSKALQVDYDVRSIVSETTDALEKCLERFPPCRWDLRGAYQGIIFGHLEAECFKKCDRKEGLFRNVIHLLEFCIETSDSDRMEGHSKARKGAARKDGVGLMHEEEEAFFSNYNSWMTQNRQDYDFDNLPRVDRFERLFTTLRILVKLLEMDLAMWILRNPTKTRQNLCHPSRCPLVAHIVWHGDYGNVNLFVKKLFQMFINMNALQYPEEDIAIFSRLLNVVAVSVNLSEFQHSDGILQYPCLQTNSRYFAEQLWKTVESSPYYSVNLCLSLLSRMQTPYLLLSLSETLFRKLNRHDHPTNVRGFFQHLLARGWTDCAEATKDASQSASDRYPLLNRQKSRTKCSEISQQQYVDLLFVGFRAYCDMYQIPAYFREIMVQPVAVFAKVHPVEKSSIFDPNAASSVFSPKALEQYILEHVSGFPGATKIVADVVSDERMIFQGVDVNSELLLEYREDIKYLMLIEQQLKKLESPEDKALFRHWIAFQSAIDPSLRISTSQKSTNRLA